MFLCETCDGEVGFAAMMKYGEDLHGEGDRSDVQCCFETEGQQFFDVRLGQAATKVMILQFFSANRTQILAAYLSIKMSLIPYFLHSLNTLAISFLALTLEV